jgi:hypothetical protein
MEGVAWDGREGSYEMEGKMGGVGEEEGNLEGRVRARADEEWGKWVRGRWRCREGGNCTFRTQHIYVDATCLKLLPPPPPHHHQHLSTIDQPVWLIPGEQVTRRQLIIFHYWIHQYCKCNCGFMNTIDSVLTTVVF